MQSEASDKISYRIDEAVKASGLGRSFLYETMGEGLLRSVKVGGRRLILRSDLLDFINRGSAGHAANTPLSPAATESTLDLPAPTPAHWTQLELPLPKRK